MSDNQDYYSRQEKRRLEYSRFSFRAMIIISLIWILACLVFGCAPKQYPATSSVGYVISVDGDRVLVAFEVVTEQRGSQASNWFYIPGHRYKKGNKYPDPDKDPSL
jgi:hypothetical protein